MKLYNSKTRKIEVFESIKKNEVMMYVCGPTVYNHAHIGNARPVVVFDVLRRLLTAIGYKVKYVSNFTDVDDRIIQIANDEKVKESVVSERFVKAYNDLRENLNADYLDATPKVTENIEAIVDFIEKLIENDFAYISGGDVFFRVRKIRSYGEISSQNVDALESGSRVDENSAKEDSLDFVLWKFTEDQGIKWESPWGLGRPGWHTECVVMIQDEFDTSLIDIHGGGMDLKFPHHENESAQAKALHHHDLANYWVHNAMLNLDGQKMSKSLGNVVWAKDYISSIGSNATRWLLLSTHYRLVLNISDSVVSEVEKELNRIDSAIKQASLVLELNSYISERHLVNEYFEPFLDAMKDDLNIENAKVELFNLIKEINQTLRIKNHNYEYISNLLFTLEEMNEILGLRYERIKLSDDDRKLYQSWDKAKADKDFEIADGIRTELIERGLI